MTTVLAFDTSTAACSAAIRRGSETRARRYEARARGQAEVLLPMIDAVMAEAGAGYADIDLIATTIGPGSFTGMRIGLAVARAMALAADLPALGLTTLEAVAASVDAAERRDAELVVCIESKRDAAYVQHFGGQPAGLDAPASRTPGELAGCLPRGPRYLLAGSAANRVGSALAAAGHAVRMSAAPAEPRAEVIARMAGDRWSPGQALTPLAPLYLKPPDTTGPGG